jgi:hypothetical protein
LQATTLLPFPVNGSQKPVPAMVQGLAVHEPRGSQSPVPKPPITARRFTPKSTVTTGICGFS